MTVLISQIAIINILFWLLFIVLCPKIKLPKIIDFAIILGACSCVGMLSTSHNSYAETTFKVTMSILVSIAVYRQYLRSIRQRKIS